MARHAAAARKRRGLLIALAMAAGVGVVIVGGRDEPSPVVRTAPTDPVPETRLYVDPTAAAADEVRTMLQTGRTAEAAIVRRIADQPTAAWFTDASPGYTDRARRLVTAAAAAGQLPVLTFYFIPQRDCSSHSAGGAQDADAYRAWLAAMAEALRGHPALVILEPDAVPQAVRGCLDKAAATQRYTLLREAVGLLHGLPGVTVYLDAGNPTWITPDRLVPALRRAGIAQAGGLALNVANFETLDDNLAYGSTLSTMLGGTHFVVDTSRNGNGPAERGAGDRHWCNPPGRKLGVPPTLQTGHPLADAYLWVKRPGESDGACGHDAPPAGQWFPAYAIALAR
ncbi:glycoside hydrolase family 6 protein [Micromonosporaceae bacterium Da 78-11]